MSARPDQSPVLPAGTARQPDLLVIGAGPAGLAAAEVASARGLAVLLAEARPSPARKFLMAGKSGLNLTKAEDAARFLSAYEEAAPWLGPALSKFGPGAVQDWAEGLGQPVFTGSSGRVFPTAMKASPLLRAWLARLTAQGVVLRTRWRWTGWQGGAVLFDTPDGGHGVTPRATVLALGGASWSRLGSDGAWAGLLRQRGVGIAPFQPANSALAVEWSPHMARHFGAAVKSVALRAGRFHSRGEFVVSAGGLEGGGIYSVSRGVREGAPLVLDLAPDLEAERLADRLARSARASLSNRLRKAGLSPVKAALLRECAPELPRTEADLARQIKTLTVPHARLRPLDEAISTAGGIRCDALTDDFMLRALPGVFAAGEMLDWEAPTGGYLLTACLATGRAAGLAAARWIDAASPG